MCVCSFFFFFFGGGGVFSYNYKGTTREYHNCVFGTLFFFGGGGGGGGQSSIITKGPQGNAICDISGPYINYRAFLVLFEAPSSRGLKGSRNKLSRQSGASFPVLGV